ncbi:MAG: hypothetical protein KKG00_02305, partial [Bacteroidetes bacterium]|nr:hypothetical protein [Bacteroidota bacterium]
LPLAIGKLNFKKVDEDFRIIDQQNHSVYAPIKVPVSAYGKPLFSENELKFLNQFDIAPLEGMLDGEEVWDKAYRALIWKSAKLAEKGTRFDLNQIIQFKTLQSIMSKFTFSLFAHSKVIQDLESQGYLIEKYGFKLITADGINATAHVYTLEQGLNEEAIHTTENYFL